MSSNGVKPASTKLFITVVRHGETDANRKHVLQGQTNYPLNEAGRDQATRAGIKLQQDLFDWVYSSDQSRAFQTAQLIVSHNESLKSKFTEDPGQVIQQNLDLRERHFGVLEGSNVSSLLEEAKKHNLTFREFTPEGGETILHVQERVQKFYNDLFSRARQAELDSKEVRVLVVTHGGWIREMLGIFVNKFGCVFPDHLGESQHQRLSPNTGINRFSLIVDQNGISDFNCQSLFEADHIVQNGEKLMTSFNIFGEDEIEPPKIVVK